MTGSQISALDIDTGAVEAISPKGGDIVAPDDLAFDDAGNLYATEVMNGRVSVRDTNGIAPGTARRPALSPTASPCTGGGCSSASAVTGGRLLELDLGGGDPRVSAGERALAQRHGGRARRAALLPGDGRQRDLAHRSRRRRARSRGRRPRRTRLGQVRRATATSSPPRCTAARCCGSIRAPASRPCWPICIRDWTT